MIKLNDTLEYVDYSHKGYTLRQFLNIWHYQINDNKTGKTVICGPASKKLTEEEAKQTIEDYILQQKMIQNKDKLKACAECGKVFLPNISNQKYCSDECAKKRQAQQVMEYYFANRKPPEAVPCKCCGALFTPSREFRAYCSLFCKVKSGKKVKPRVPKVPKKETTPKKCKETLCWTCQNACGGCSWSRGLKPVDGWKAKEVTKASYKGQKSYKVIECPEYKEGR